MDPVTIAILGTLMGGTFLKMAETMMSKSKTGVVGSISFDYDDRWSNSDYIRMIHETRTTEKMLGIEPTECGCKLHKAVEPKPAVLEEKPKPKFYTRILGDYLFKLDEAVVPRHAHGMFDYNRMHGIFVWTDTTTGERKAMKAIPQIDIPYSEEVIVWGEDKPVKELTYYRQADGTIFLNNTIIAGRVSAGQIYMGGR